MNEMKIISNKENSKKKINAKQFKTITIKKIFSSKFRPKLINNNNIKLLSHSKENKLSQTLIKKYNYEVNNLAKSNKLTESLNLIASHKYIPAKPFLYSKIKDLIQKIIKDNQINHTVLKRSESSKVFNKFKENLSMLNINDIYKKIKINKKIFHKKIILNKKKNNRNLENIDTNFFNSLNKNKFNKSTTQFENKNMKYKLNNNNSTPDIKVIKKSQSMSKIFQKISNETRKLNKNLILSSKIFNKKHPNHIVIRNDFLLHSEKKRENINIWKDKILSDLLTNIQSTNNADLSKEKIGKNLNQKFRISTLMNLYNKSYFNSNNNYEL